MADQEILDDIRKALAGLNGAIDAASRVDIHVDFVKIDLINRINPQWALGECERRTRVR